MSAITISKFPHISALEKGKQVEYEDPIKGEVSGEVPSWLRGSWYRNGPGVIHFKEQSVTHWFDGMALPKRFEIKDGNVFYRSRLIQSKSYQKNIDAGRVVVPEFGTHVQTEQRANILTRAMTMLALPEFTDNCLVNIMRVGDYLFAISETNLIRRLDPITLETLEKVDLSKYIPINLMSSRPLTDDEGTVYNFTTSLLSMGRTKYNLISIPKPQQGESVTDTFKKASCVASIDSAWRISPSYHHNFSMSENYAPFIEQPLKLSISKMAVAHWSNMAYSECLESHMKLNTNIFVVDKRVKALMPTTYVTDPLIVYQHVNSYEEDNHLIMDIACFDTEIFFQKYSMENLHLSPKEFMAKFEKEENRIRVKRFVLPLDVQKDARIDENLVRLSSTSCTAMKLKNGNIFLNPEVICEGTDYPAINLGHIGKPYRYFYSVGGAVLPPGEEIIKVDTMRKEKLHTWKEDGCWASSLAFVQRPNSTEEDDGILMSSVHSEHGSPFLLMLDGKTFEEKARVTFDANIPPDLHGLFIPEK